MSDNFDGIAMQWFNRTNELFPAAKAQWFCAMLHKNFWLRLVVLLPETKISRSVRIT
jgi:hypothetical protein